VLVRVGEVAEVFGMKATIYDTVEFRILTVPEFTSG